VRDEHRKKREGKTHQRFPLKGEFFLREKGFLSESVRRCREKREKRERRGGGTLLSFLVVGENKGGRKKEEREEPPGQL